MQTLILFIAIFRPCEGLQGRFYLKTIGMKNNKLIAALIIAVLLTADIAIIILVIINH